MTLEEAIRQAEEAAQKCEDFVRCHSCDRELGFVKRCQKCADEHRQLAEWLKELKIHREAWGKVKRTVKAYLMLEGFGSAYQDDIENLIEGCIPKESEG
jgi:hypothetical protein